MVSFFTAGLVLGLSAGFSPGPLQTLVISQSLKYGIPEGLRVALVPLITDLPIIILSIFIVNRLESYESLLGILSISGGFFLIFLSVESFRTHPISIDKLETSPNSVGKGALINLLNPHPYLFWFTVGGPILVQAWDENPLKAISFLVAFYGAIVGAKMIVALLVGKSRQFVHGKTYLWIMRGLGLLLLGFAFLLIHEGLVLIGVFSQ